MNKQEILEELEDMVYTLGFQGEDMAGDLMGLVVELRKEVILEGMDRITDKPKTVYDLDEGDDHYHLDRWGDVEKLVWYNDVYKQDERKQGNIRLNPEPLERKAKVREAVESIRKYKLENGLMFEPDWESDEKKWVITYSCSLKKFQAGWICKIKSDTQIGYFKTEKDAEQVISDCESELRVIFNLD